jgi:predicted nuclease with TOPRIM domain
VSQSSSNSEQQPENPQPRIDQDSSGNSSGGQQAAIGDGNFQYQDNRTTNNIYLDLQDEDLEPLSLWGKVLSYFKVFIFLVITLIFWTFFGIFTSFPFPYGQAIDLMLCCFKGTVASKVNRLQKRLPQSENLSSQSVQKLNNCDFQVRLYLGVLKYLGRNKAESHERLAKTIESLKHKKSELQDEIRPRQPQNYRTVTRIQDFLESMTLSRAERDLIQIESILNEVTWAIKNNYPSETIVQDTIDRLSRETTRRADKISPFRIGVLYRIEALLREVSDKEISNLGESELNELNKKIISGLKEEKDTLSRELSRVRDENYIAQQRLRDYLEELGRLNSILDERESDLSKLRENLRDYAEANQSKQFEINNLNSELIRVDEELGKLQAQKSFFSEQIHRLNQDVHQKQARIEQLTNQLNQYSQIRTLKGRYIGNLSDTKSKYHFNQKCNHWKMLVGEYVLKLDVSRKIASSDTPTLFIREGLGECDICAERKTQNRRA